MDDCRGIRECMATFMVMKFGAASCVTTMINDNNNNRIDTLEGEMRVEDLI